jgi:alkylated DNA repair protein alkB family protein 8
MITAFHTHSPHTSDRKRLSQHYGHHFDYTTFSVSTSNFTPVPPYITDFLPRLPIQEHLPDQFTIQYYPPGSGIPPHVDTHSVFEEALYSLSFGAGVMMVFKRAGANEARKLRLPKRSLMATDKDTAGHIGASRDAQAPTNISKDDSSDPTDISHAQPPSQDEPSFEILLPPRSLLLMTGPSRYGYTHGIKARKTDIIDGQTVSREGRYSITMRTTRSGEAIRCDCAYPGVCDARVREEQAARETVP